jgi:hypothetical protein
MLRQLATITLLSAAMTLPMQARGNLKELTVPLKFAPQEAVHEATAVLPPGMLDLAVAVQVEDARKLQDLLVIGTGTGGDDKPFPIRADREVRGYVREALASIGTAWALKLEGTPARNLTIRIMVLHVDESNKALGSMYSADANLAFSLTDAQGRVLSSGMGSGSTHRYGRAHSPDNINEVLSDALKEAYATVLSDPGLQSAWVSGKPTGSATQTAAPRESVEDRLKKLEDLYKRGLITKEEYQKRREEILKDI